MYSVIVYNVANGSEEASVVGNFVFSKKASAKYCLDTEYGDYEKTIDYDTHGEENYLHEYGDESVSVYYCGKLIWKAFIVSLF